MFAPLLVSMASEYNNALLVIENNHDYGVLNKIEEIGYDNIYYSLKATHEFVDRSTAEARGGSRFYNVYENSTSCYIKT